MAIQGPATRTATRKRSASQTGTDMARSYLESPCVQAVGVGAARRDPPGRARRRGGPCVRARAPVDAPELGARGRARAPGVAARAVAAPRGRAAPAGGAPACACPPAGAQQLLSRRSLRGDGALPRVAVPPLAGGIR